MKESNIPCVCKKRTCPRCSAACVVCEAVGNTPDNVEEKMEARAAPQWSFPMHICSA